MKLQIGQALRLKEIELIKLRFILNI